jgi:hypothetical protein
MPRPPRLQFAGAIYHLMNRGVRGEDLYTDAREHLHCRCLQKPVRVTSGLLEPIASWGTTITS